MAAMMVDQRSGLRALFTFPHPVNEYAARSVAAMVFTLALVIIVADVRWLLFVLAYGFLARVLTGPKLSPMGLLATRVIAPNLLRRSKLVLFAGLEAFVGFCAGCFVFGYLMRWGLIPAETCERCNNLSFGAERSA